MLDPLSHLTDRPIRSLLGLMQEGLHTLWQLLFLSLLLLGLGGVVFKAVRPDGWLETLLSGAWNASPGYAMVTLTAVFVAGLWARRVSRRLDVFSRHGEWPVYGCLALGAFFAVQLIFGGSL
jgi:hypothetical protein